MIKENLFMTPDEEKTILTPSQQEEETAFLLQENDSA